MQFLLKIMLVTMPFFIASHALSQSSSTQSKSSLGHTFESEDWIRFKPELKLSATSFFVDHKAEMGLSTTDKMVLLESVEDQLGFVHHKFQQMFQHIPVEFAVYTLHEKDGVMIKGNGKLAEGVNVNTHVNLLPENALDLALDCIGAESYYWEYPQLEASKQNATGDPNATFYPIANLLVVDNDFDPDNAASYRLAYKFEIHSAIPSGRSWVYVDAQSGEIVKELDINMHSTPAIGTAETRYSGVKEIITDSTENGFVLKDYTRGLGIETYDALDSFNVDYRTDFVDADNYWDHANDRADDAATDAHWAAEMLYDYLRDVHGQDSYDDRGSKLISHVHVGQNWRNALWNGCWAEFGDGTSGQPWTAVDVVGHEFAHGMTTNSAGLIYSRESGALNESFSDIFAEALKDFIFDTVDWLQKASPVDTIRSLINPKDYGDPDTYLGENWVTDAGDNYGVHTNSGVQNHWMYLVSEGGNGTNDNGDAYMVDGIGIQTAIAIIMRSMKIYLDPTSGYADARQGALFAAEDLYGSCSFEYQQVANAWHAVGVGSRQEANDFTVVSVENFELCNLDDSESVTMKIKYMGCDTTGPISLIVSLIKSNPPSVYSETLEIPEGIHPGDVIDYTFEEEFNFSRNGDHVLTGKVKYENDPFKENDSSPPITAFNPATVNDQSFPFYTNFVPRSFRDTIAFVHAPYAELKVQNFVGKDSTVGVVVEGFRAFLTKAVHPGEDIFEVNDRHVAQLCFCVDAAEYDSLGLQFDLRQTYSSMFDTLDQPPSSAMRVMISETELARFLPETYADDEWKTHNLDLEAYLGDQFTVCLQTCTLLRALDAHDGIADRVYLDNIVFTNSPVETSIKSPGELYPLTIYPNPTNSVSTIEINSEESGSARITMRQTNGGIVWQTNSTITKGLNAIQINVSNFAPGIYFIEVKTEHEAHIGKIVVP